MFDVYHDNGTLSLSTQTYPLRLFKSFTMNVVTNRMNQGGAASFYVDQAPGNLLNQQDCLIFMRHSKPGATTTVWYEGRPSQPYQQSHPYGLPLWIASDVPGTVQVYVCKLMSAAQAPAVNFGIELYDDKGLRTFSSATHLVGLQRMINPALTTSGTLATSTMAWGSSMEAFYRYFDNPFLMTWNQGVAFTGAAFTCYALGYVHHGGPAFCYRKVLDPSIPVVPVLFIETANLPIPYN
ncbi:MULTISPECIES: hypothetical protein [unclassified Pseudomonas]|uniref:hypothetical protein n=1 Tax=unclassified Pseudomonas TaxID=196821 RepID=UPI0020982E4E|nr:MULTISPECIES: hypothetical protein [unclassified Pseudomonas]MCO7518770.1 hypothetical protein [Pseudomonas sp. 1]MCO7540795.1 hypothetical protein [Pseudomonas sp. VA159-2]